MSKPPVPSMPAVPCARAVRRPKTVHHGGQATQQPVLITTQQVLFGTAAAMPPPKSRFAVLWRIASAPSRLVSRRSRRAGSRSARRYPPARLTFMEEAAMSREMGRL